MQTVADARFGAHSMAPTMFRVATVGREVADTVTLELDPQDAPFAFAAGQFTMLYAFGTGEIPVSISGDPSDPTRLVQTIRAVGAVSRTLCSANPGDLVGVRGPFGRGWPIEEAFGKDVLIIAGGIGLAPLRPAIYQILAERDRFEQVTIVYGARTPEDLLYADEIRRWRSRFDLDVMVTVDRAGRSWHGSVGVVTKLLRFAEFDPENVVAMMCGPEVMMRFTVQELEVMGLTDDQIYHSLERNMKCGIGLCGHCQLGKFFVCKDGPVIGSLEMAGLGWIREV